MFNFDWLCSLGEPKWPWFAVLKYLYIELQTEPQKEKISRKEIHLGG